MSTVTNLVIHTPECTELARKIADGRQAFLNRWPDYCRACNSEGGHSSSQNHGPGLTEPMFDICPQCMEQNKCPRCGSEWPELEDGDDGPCKVCNWNWGKTPGDILPAEYPDGPCGCAVVFEQMQYQYQSPSCLQYKTRYVTLQLFEFDQLSPAAQEMAIAAEREILVPTVREMAEAYAEQLRLELRTLNLTDDCLRVKEVHLVGAPPSFCHEAERLLCDEVSKALSDKAVIENIRAGNMEYLADGTPWVYADKEPNPFYSGKLGVPYEGGTP